MSLILASGSATRAMLLRQAGVPFTAHPADVDEDAIKAAEQAKGNSPPAAALILAQVKALAVAAKHPGHLVLGADQILEYDGIVSKSANLQEAQVLLRRLRGRTHSLHTAAVLARDTEVLAICVEEASLAMRDFSEGFLAAYLASEGEAILGSVGGYRLEGPGLQLFEAIDGDYFAILGLPLLPLLTELRRFGILPA